jgi:hypothetical protein
MSTRSTPRIFVILPREGCHAVVFRRGPSKQVQLLRWNTQTDEFEPGQWLKGRVYERRCDLSPSGKFLIYFATKHKPPWDSWTAISKPPFLTALAIMMDCGTWTGGGLFLDESTVVSRGTRFKGELPKGFRIVDLVTVQRASQPIYAMWPEADGNWCKPIELSGVSCALGDQPIYSLRLQRDGWRLLQEGIEYKRVDGEDDGELRQRLEQMSFVYEPAEIYSKTGLAGCELEMKTLGVGEKSGDWYVTEYRLLDTEGKSLLDLGRIDWADWDKNGDLLYTRDGQMFRLSPDPGNANLFDVNQSRSIYDFRSATFAPLAPTPQALSWD